MGDEIITLNPKEAIIWFLSTHPDMKPITMWDLDEDRYLLYVEQPGIKPEDDFNDPYYTIDKHGFAILRFVPAGELELFGSATKKKPVMTRKGA